jgi:hypothetical protein
MTTLDTRAQTDTGGDNVTVVGGPTIAPTAYVLDASSGPLSGEELRVIDAWWRAANYLAVGQIYLIDNPLLERPLEENDVKPRLLGHWGTTPGLNLVYAHANRAIRARDHPRGRRLGLAARRIMSRAATIPVRNGRRPCGTAARDGSGSSRDRADPPPR